MELVRTSLEDDKGEDITVIDLCGKTTLADYMVIVSGRTHRQVGAMSDHLLRKLKNSGVRGVSVEGMSGGDWVLVDAGDVVIHLFRPEVREFYKLEKLWSAIATGTAEAEQVARLA